MYDLILIFRLKFLIILAKLRMNKCVESFTRDWQELIISAAYLTIVIERFRQKIDCAKALHRNIATADNNRVTFEIA